MDVLDDFRVEKIAKELKELLALCFRPQSYVTTRFMLCFSAWQCAFMCIFLHTCHADRRVGWGLGVGVGGGFGWGGGEVAIPGLGEPWKPKRTPAVSCTILYTRGLLVLSHAECA